MTAPVPYFDDGQVSLYLGDCLDVLAGLPDCSIDAVCTDPPYGIGFMGKEWDSGKSFVERKPDRRNTFDHVGGNHNPADSADAARTRRVEGQRFGAWCEVWAAECLRVLKPGGWMLAFGGTRTWHRLACAIEDAGFEIRDSVADLTGQDAPGLMWIHGQGFPKSRDVGKAIDKAAGAEREVIGKGINHDAKVRHGGTWTGGVYAQDDYTGAGGPLITAPATEEAARWSGWGTALKPAWEPIVVARKPLVGTVAQNVIEHGTGALNIDGCRVGGGSRPARTNAVSASGLTGTGGAATYGSFAVRGSIATGETDTGRWPPNVLLAHSASCEQIGVCEVKSDGHHPSARGGSGYEGGLRGQSGLAERKSGTETVEAWDCAPDCPVAELDRQSGVLTSGKLLPHHADNGKAAGALGAFAGASGRESYGDSGGASRFFPAFRWQAKAPASERPRLADGTAHPTVKPLALMRWLARLVTPPGGTVLDLFAGSGTTAEACIIEGFNCILVEKDPASAELIKTRLGKPIQPDLFGGAA